MSKASNSDRLSSSNSLQRPSKRKIKQKLAFKSTNSGTLMTKSKSTLALIQVPELTTIKRFFVFLEIFYQ